VTGLDINANRRQRPYSFQEYLGRVLWSIVHPFFSLSPRPCFGWRRALLRLFGASVGAGANVYPSARIALPWRLVIGAQASIGEDVLVYNLGLVTIGERATVSHRAHLCAGTHDHSNPALPLIRPSITIGPQAWVCAQAFVGPAVTVGEGAIVGAAAVVMRDVPPWLIVVGNPAKVVGRRELKVQP
jgi:putative colanic acid biosynthesis acetyltransferase WcaF